MITAGLKKESLFYCRKRLIVMIIILLFMALVNPVLYKTLDATMSAADMQGIDVGQAETLWNAMGGNLPVTAVVTSFTTIYSFGLIVFFLTIMPMAGGERSSRAEIIPRLAGLSHEGFVIPKFLFYVVLSFVISTTACYLSVTAASVIAKSDVPQYYEEQIDSGPVTGDSGSSVTDPVTGLFPEGEREQLSITSEVPSVTDTSVTFNGKDGLGAAALIGLFFAFCTSLYLFTGITTGRPGLSVILTLLGVEAISFVLEKISSNGYNPTALTQIGTALLIKGIGGTEGSGVYGNMFEQTLRISITPANIAASVISSLILIAVFMLLTIVLRRAHEIDNTADIAA